MKLNNNLVAALILLFIVISLSSNFFILNKISTIQATGKAVTTGQLILCINKQPVLSPIGNQSAINGVLFTLYINASDDDGDSMTFYDNATFFNITTINATTGLINFTSTQQDRGNHTINISVDDNTGCANSADSEIINFTIIYNDPPVLDPIGQQNLTQNIFYYYDVNATDPDNDTLTFYDNTTIFDIDPVTGVIAFTPSQSHVGLHYVNISVKDTYDAYDYEVVLFNITDVNDAPVLDPIGNQTAYVNLTFSLYVTASDLDNDNLTFHSNATFFNITNISATTGLISFTPSAAGIGNHSILIWVLDHYNDSEAIDTEIVLFTILPYNAPPIANVTYPNGGEVVSGNISVNATVYDIDGNGTIQFVNFHYSNDSANWVHINNDSYNGDADYNITWNTSSVPDGYRYRIKINASDGVNNVSDISDGMFVINNLDEEPIWDNFKYNLTTNFTALNNPALLGEFTRVENVTIGIPGKGLINFSGHTLNVDGINLDIYVNISHKLIGIDVSELWQLNKSAVLTFYNITYIYPSVLMNGADCPASICAQLSYSNNTLVINVTQFAAFRVTEGAPANLVIWDSTDLNETKLANQSVRFYANYTDEINNNSVNGTNIYCKISFNISNSNPDNMLFNHSSMLYEYNRSFDRRGTYAWNVSCNGSYLDLGITTESDNVNITNTPPRLAISIPDATWYEDTSIVNWIDLDDYFFDIDSDVLTCTYVPVTYITISIDSYNRVTLLPNVNWYGMARTFFTCNDSINSTASNNFTLHVRNVPEVAPPPPPAGGGGGGGVTYVCEEQWICSDWSVCFENKTQARSCIDYAECGTIKNKPNETQSCYYITCYNGIRDGDETDIDCGGSCPPCGNCSDGIKNCHNGLCEMLIDCGGPCEPCPTCDDGIRNGGEFGIDCGGPCRPCPSCFDGILNQNETSIDCGGPCKPCPVIEQPGVIAQRGTIIMITISLIVILIILITLIYYGSSLIERAKLAFYTRRIPTHAERRYIAETTMSKLLRMEKSIDKRPVDEISIEFISTTKKFFNGHFGLTEFSYPNLIKNIEKEKIDAKTKGILNSFLKDLAGIERRSYNLTKGDILALIKKMKSIIKSISNIKK